ncbi:MAG: hypothetical protein NC930_07450 [Candidatus Omnitrophica bacterium]|nr:hypothetical protein [Candidatus Omnitrophota bacterium]
MPSFHPMKLFRLGLSAMMAMAMLSIFQGCAGTSSVPQPVRKPVPENKSEPIRMYSPNGGFYIDLVPEKRLTLSGFGKGTAYASGSDQPQWSIDWYSRSIILCDDGMHLIRVGQAGRDMNGLSDLAVGFYEKGRELKSYRVKDLVKNPDQLWKGFSEYQWKSRLSTGRSGLSGDQKEYTLVLIDGTVYTFSVETGEVLRTGKDPRAMGYHV